MTPGIWTGMYHDIPLDKAIERLVSQGWKAFEVSSEHLIGLETAGEPGIQTTLDTVAATGVSLFQAHAYLQANILHSDDETRTADISRIERHIGFCGKLGIGVIVIHPGQCAEKPSPAESIRNNARAIGRLADIASESGIRIGIENLTRLDAAYPVQIAELVDEIDRDEVGIVFDTSHAGVIGFDIPAAIVQLGTRIIGTHISDTDGSGDQHKTPGAGKIDWPGVVEALRTVGYSGYLNFEIPGERHANLELRALKSTHARDVAEWLAGMSREPANGPPGEA